MLVMLLSIIPILYNVYLSTTDMSLFHYHDYRFVGAANYVNLFTSPVSDFTRLFVWNIVYSLSCILVPFVVGRRRSADARRIAPTACPPPPGR